MLDRHLSVGFFVAFLPILLFQEKRRPDSSWMKMAFGIPWLSLFLWQSIDLSWLSYMGWEKVFLIAASNSLIFCLPFVLRYLFLSWERRVLADFLWLSSWIALEFLHMQWSLSFPLFQLGNYLAAWPSLIQWYEWTGVLGGSLWFLVVNLMTLYALKNGNRISSVPFIRLASILLIPIGASVFLLNHFQEGKTRVQVLSLHPNTNCYSEKFTIPQGELIRNYLKHTEESLQKKTRYVLWPETAIPRGPWIDALNQDADIQLIGNLLRQYPQTNFISGINTYASSPISQNKLTALHATSSAKGTPSYLTYNAIVQWSDQQQIQIRSKSRLVPFEEINVLPSFLKPLQKWIGSASGQEYSRLRNNPITQLGQDQRTRSGTLICYESAFGSISNEMSRKGADVLFVLLNEGWYDNLRGAQKFLDLSIIRAIETRKSVVRSSNRGISAAISPFGQVLDQLKMQKASVLKAEVSLNERVTLYSRVGDWVAYLAILLGLLCFPFALFFPRVESPAK